MLYSIHYTVSSQKVETLNDYRYAYDSLYLKLLEQLKFLLDILDQQSNCIGNNGILQWRIGTFIFAGKKIEGPTH